MEKRQYQDDAVAAVLANDKGIISMATGGGKTTVMARVIENQDGSILVLVHTRALLVQTVNRLKEETSKSVGAYYGEDKSGLNSDIVVATWQSLVLLKQKLVYDHVHVDECHNARGKKYSRLIRSISCKTLHGYTATLHGPGEEEIKSIFGDIIHETGLFELIQQGYLSKMKVLINIGPIGARKYNEDKFKIIREQTGNNGTIQKAIHFYGRNKRFKEIKNWNLLPIGTYAEVSARVKKDAREELFDSFRSPDSGINHLLSNRVLNEGIDLPITNCLIFHETVGDYRIVSQRFGRGLRMYHNDKNDMTIIFLFVDENNKAQVNMVNILVTQVEYEGKKHGENTVRTVRTGEYKKHLNDPNDDIPITINLIDRTNEVLRRFKLGKRISVSNFTLEEFISDMRALGIENSSQYYFKWRKICNGKYGAYPHSILKIDLRELWDKINDHQSEKFTIEDFINDMRALGIKNGNQYSYKWKEICNRKYVAYPHNKLKITGKELWDKVNDIKECTLEDFINDMRALGIKNGNQYSYKWREICNGKYGSLPYNKLKITGKELWEKVNNIKPWTIEEFINDMRILGITYGNQYYDKWKEICNGKYGAYPHSILKITGKELWDKVNNREKLTIEEFIKDMRTLEIKNGNKYISKWREICNGKYGSLPHRHLNISAKELWDKVRESE